MIDNFEEDKGVVTAKKYFRIKDLMTRYGYSRGHITNLIKAGTLPPPLIFNNVKQWPIEVIETIDRQRNRKYFDTLRNQGFPVPEKLL